MKPETLLSIIIPVYNVKEYLPKCIESVLAQSYRTFELILVDICDNFALKDSRKRVIHKANEGVSSARNIGMRLANGEYISFIDSDDYLDADYLVSLVHTMHNSQADLVISSYVRVDVR